MLRKIVGSGLRRLGFVVVDVASWRRITGQPPDIASDDVFLRLHERCKPYTLTSTETLFALYKAVEYCERNRIPGDFVECGVWRGGSAMMMALALQHFGGTDRGIVLYDTYEGMSAPTEVDKTFEGRDAASLLGESAPTADRNIWCYSTLEEVRENLALCGYPPEKIAYVKGKVEDTIPGTVPSSIALLRLDTDWYESTRHELVHLYPLVASRGALIIDDYGHWQGARKAVDEYFGGQKEFPLLARVDFSCRLVVKA